MLVSAEWAEGHLGGDGVVFVEVDEQTEAYAVNHLPGALSLDWRNDLRAPVGRDFIDNAGFEESLSRKGIANDDTMLLYEGDNNWFAALRASLTSTCGSAPLPPVSCSGGCGPVTSSSEAQTDRFGCSASALQSRSR
jgi:3-mercaptopyruvate sulfurtransferase SseA